MSEKERSRLSVNVLFANINPKEHIAWNRQWISKLTDSAYSYTTKDPVYETVRQYEEAGEISRKAIYDYTFAMRQCYDSGAQWIAIFEDDIIFADGWYLQTLRSLFDISKRIKDQTAQAEWIYLRLFNQERSTGWASRRIGGNHEFLISLGVAAAFCPMLLIGRKHSPKLRRHVDDHTLGVVFCLIIPSFVVLFFQAGKASLLPPSPGTYMQRYGCCSQGLVFPREIISTVIDYLHFREDGKIDVLINQLQIKENLDRYTLYPVQLQHVGESMPRIRDQLC